MDRIVECVPNFSEGRDAEKVRRIVSTIASVPGVVVLDHGMDADHHRSVVTYAGEPSAVVEAARRAAEVAVSTIDLTRHQGAHPRIGALDVLPFIPLRGVTMAECVALAKQAGELIARQLNLPVFLYEEAATRPDRADLANVRRGEFEGLRTAIESDPARRPDFGPPRLHPTAGAIAVGARSLLIAYNINLATDDLLVAKKIARAIRGRDGGLRYVKALGLPLEKRRQVQVSINLVRYQATPLHRVFEMVRREAERYGVAIAGSEIIGLLPRAALEASAEYYLQIENFSPESILEERLQSALAAREGPVILRATEVPQGGTTDPTALSLDEFAGEVASDLPPVGAGGVVAYVGALAAALGAFVCRSSPMATRGTVAPPDQVSPRIDEDLARVLGQLTELSGELRITVGEEAEARAASLAWRDRSSAEEADRLARLTAAEAATRRARSVSLRVVTAAHEVLELLLELAERQVPVALADLVAGAQLAAAATRGAACLALAQLPSRSDEELSGAEEGQPEELRELLLRSREILERIEQRFFAAHSLAIGEEEPPPLAPFPSAPFSET
ncbi:MAG: glutamate formimidoyltransferase [Blastocatellia bacterium]